MRFADARGDAHLQVKAPLVCPPESAPAESATAGFMRFLNGYTQHPLLKFSPGSRSSALLSPIVSGLDGSSTGAAPSSGASCASDAGADEKTEGAGAAGLLARTHLRDPATGLYPLWTVALVALVAFLVGSLLRSLISPADFIYVVTDEKEIGSVSQGWREIRRLLEVKYVVGGWDFQIAVVRRH